MCVVVVAYELTYTHEKCLEKRSMGEIKRENEKNDMSAGAELSWAIPEPDKSYISISIVFKSSWVCYNWTRIQRSVVVHSRVHSTNDDDDIKKQQQKKFND